jgi:hypothetical protein
MVHLEGEGDFEEDAPCARQAGPMEIRHKPILRRNDLVIVCILTGSKSLILLT